MKKNLFFAFLILISIHSFSQDFSKFENYSLETKDDFHKAEELVMEGVQYMFATSFDKNDLKRFQVLHFVMNWMEGTPEYRFNIDQKAVDLTKGNDDLLGMYFAGLAKVILERKNQIPDDETVHNLVIQDLLAYTSIESNNLKATKALKKLVKS